jgi:polysaccharide biosynthesis protein PslG
MIRWPSSRSGLVLAGLLWVALVAIMIVAILDEGEGPGPPQPGRSAVERCAPPLIGVHSSVAWEADPERRAAIVGADEELGAQIVRTGLLWHQVQPTEGESDWTRPDSVIHELSAAGMEPLLIVLGSPSWANGVPASEPGHYFNVPARGPALEAWLKRYSAFLAQAVERYKGLVQRWEIWNEPNTVAFWRPQPDPLAYQHVYERLRATILRVDPRAKVAVGGLTGLTATSPPNIAGLDFLQALLQTRTPIDNVAIHPYSSEDHRPGLHIAGENNFDDIQQTRRALLAAGRRVPIWVTEWGWSSSSVGASAQARYVDTSLAMIEHRYPFVRVATYFVDHDLPPTYLQGLLDQDLDPKPAAAAFRTHARLAAARCDES